jgi:hypothetical protein
VRLAFGAAERGERVAGPERHLDMPNHL